jgi:hypothetical protein
MPHRISVFMGKTASTFAAGRVRGINGVHETTAELGYTYRVSARQKDVNGLFVIYVRKACGEIRAETAGNGRTQRHADNSFKKRATHF